MFMILFKVESGPAVGKWMVCETFKTEAEARKSLDKRKEYSSNYKIAFELPDIIPEGN